MTDVQAAIGRAQLRRFESTQERRADTAARYDSLIVDIPGLTLPPRPMSGRHAWHLYAVRVRPSFGVSRDDLIAALSERGIGTSVHFIPIHRLTWYSQICLQEPCGFPGAEDVFEQTLSLPMDQVMTDDDVVTVCTALAEIGVSR